MRPDRRFPADRSPAFFDSAFFGEILHQTGIDRKRDLTLIFLRAEQRGFVGIGEKAAFRHDSRMLGEIAKKEFLTAALDLAFVVGLQAAKLRLQTVCERFAVGIRVSIEHLCAGILRVSELILVNRDADGVVRRIEYRQTVIHIRGFLVGDAFNSGVVNGTVGVACHLDRVAG